MGIKLQLKLAFIFLLSLGCMYVGYTKDRASSASSQWQSTPGIVINSNVVVIERKDGRGTYTEYSPVIIYEYESPLGKIRSNRVNYLGPVKNVYKFQAEELVARYKPGTPVTVFFNPDKPGQSCLQPGRTRNGIGYMVLGALLLLGELIFLGFRSLDRYAGMGDFDPDVVKQNREKETGKASPKEGPQETASSPLQELMITIQNSPLIKRHLETHLFFGPIYRKTRFGSAAFTLLNSLFGRRFALFSGEQQVFFFFLLSKALFAGLAVVFVSMSPFLFLMKAPDAPADLFLGLIWLPGLEFIPKLTAKQKYITIARILLTIPAVYMGIQSGNWSW